MEGYGVGKGVKGVLLSIIEVADLAWCRGCGGCSGSFRVGLSIHVISECQCTREIVNGWCLREFAFERGKMNLTVPVLGVGKLCLLREYIAPFLIINGSSASFGE